jgi:hypothetical protein
MNDILRRVTRSLLTGAALALITQAFFFGPHLAAQGRGGQPPGARAADPVDLTGYFVSVVTEDWRFRMVTPEKGDYASVPLNSDGRKTADAWDPAKDEASGEQCKSYGAPGLLRIPGRIHITRRDENTLQVEADAGTQTRLLHINAKVPANEAATLQGYSVASWDIPGAGGRGRGGPPMGGSLKVVTTNLKPGYLRKNGVPYGANAVLTEYFSKTAEPNGDSWLIVTTIVEDPQYLNAPFITSTNFKRQADGSGWAPTACTAK